jgi:hypothetical protein
MECAALLSYLVTQAFKPFPNHRFQGRRVRPSCHRHVSPANLAGKPTNPRPFLNAVPLPMAAIVANRDASLQQQSTNLVDHRRTTGYPALAHPVERLQIQSFLLVFTEGFTYLAGISLASCPCSRRARAGKCAPKYASMSDWYLHSNTFRHVPDYELHFLSPGRNCTAKRCGILIIVGGLLVGLWR